jgi:hypothetical protein
MNTSSDLVATRFYLTIYGFQTAPNFLRTAHTFAVVTKKLSDGSSPEEPSIISWLPDAGTIHLVGAEKGRNYSLPETLAFKSPDAILRATPTQEIAEEFYNSFMDRKRELESGSVEFVMNDRLSTRPNNATNCIHAVSDLSIALAALPMLNTYTQHGYDASFAVYTYFQPWFLKSKEGAMRAMAPPISSLAEAEILDEETLSAFH